MTKPVISDTSISNVRVRASQATGSDIVKGAGEANPKTPKDSPADRVVNKAHDWSREQVILRPLSNVERGRATHAKVEHGACEAVAPRE